MPHIHSIYDTDKHFIIDPITRSITAEAAKITLMQKDHNSERFTFAIPRFIEGHDMSKTDKVEIHYNNIDASNKRTMNQDIYEVEDLQISPDSDDTVICSWLISKNATMYAGSLSFVVRFACYADATISYQWFSDVFSGIKVLGGIYNAEVLDSKYDIDVIEKWKRDIIQAFYESDVYADTLAYRDAAMKSATAAKTSETNTKASELNAGTHASDSAKSASAAKTSQTAAANSATSAANSATAASTSASNASSAASTASNSAASAKSFMSSASTYATNAANSAVAANNSQKAAAESASAAKTSEKTVADTVASLITNGAFITKGNYLSSATYDILDVVTHNNKLWICKKAGTKGVEPNAANTTNWQLAIELTPITNEEIDALDPIVPTELTSASIPIDELDEILT